MELTVQWVPYIPHVMITDLDIFWWHPYQLTSATYTSHKPSLRGFSTIPRVFMLPYTYREDLNNQYDAHKAGISHKYLFERDAGGGFSVFTGSSRRCFYISSTCMGPSESWVYQPT